MSISTKGLLQLKRLVPAPLKRKAKDALLSRTFARAIADISKLPLGEVPPREVLERLQRGWGNEGFAAQMEYLEEVGRRAATTAGPILECGSGLTTILMGLLAGRRGVQIWSLEHISDWRARVERNLKQFSVPNTQVRHTLLRDYEGFSWYDAPLDELPKEFQLVICDGPPGETRGGRYGLLPILGDRLPSGSVILLDDATRSGEAEVLRRWTAEANVKVAMRTSTDGSFAVVTRN
jgi:predicted O-methyltransferase YrrM